ncbi:MAG TPA: protein kinase [Bryobacteraceae bacterium]|nr:protein kinase [Bryobacteraceae bacterium]
MPSKAQDDDLVMSLVEQALDQPPCERTTYLRNSCGDDIELLSEVRKYVEWEQRMAGFLLDPLYELASEEPPFDPGEVLDARFRILREVGRGGMAIVYEAMDEKLDRRVALKCAKVGFQQRLPPEVRHATEISHPNVCKIFEIHTASTKHGEIDFITMEFLEGETLAERLRRGPLPKPEARVIASQICEGLSAAHHSDVVHGDLKSGNVMLTAGRNGAVRAVITDFGMARPARSNSQSGERGGTPDYMAPELWRGEQPSVASDVYALGVLLYELAAGRRPDWSNVSDEDRLSWKPSPVDSKWDRILARCLEPNPERRFQIVDEVVQALAPASSRRWFLPASAALVLAAITGAVTYQRATAPAESVRLAVLPFESDIGTATFVPALFRDTGRQLARLEGNAHTAFIFQRNQAGATLVLHGSLHKENGKLILMADLTDARSQLNTKEWKAAYLPSEMRYAPVALAGMVTASLRLPPLEVAPVNAGARRDYSAGLSALRRDAGVDASIHLLERAVAADPDSPLTYAGLAEAEWFKYSITGERIWLDRASESVREAQLRDLDSAPVHRIAGMLEDNASRYESAEAEYRRATELEPNNSDAYRRLAMVLKQNNQVDAALAAYRRAIELEPENYRNHQALGAFYIERADYSEAAAEFQKTVELAPAEPDPRMAYATALMNLGRYTDAESQLRSAIQLHETAMAVHQFGSVLMYQSREAEAIPYFLHSLSLNHPLKYLAWMQLGTAYRRIGRPAEAESANRRGLALIEEEVARDPRNGYMRSYLAYFCARLGERARAESEIAQALQLSSSNADTHEIAVLTYEALGERDNTLAVLSSSSNGLLADLNRWPDVADLRKDPRFLQLLASRQIN